MFNSDQQSRVMLSHSTGERKVLDFAWSNTVTLKRKIPGNRAMKGLGSSCMIRLRLGSEVELRPRTQGFPE